MSKTIRIKNELPELIEAVCLHRDCPEWLKHAIWDAFNERTHAVTYSAHWWRAELAEIEDSEENEASETVDRFPCEIRLVQ